jgi:hypothetical protein
MSVFDAFLQELHDARMTDIPVKPVLGPIFRKLETDPAPATRKLHDDLIDIIGHKRPLLARLVDVVRLLERAAAAQ